MPYSEKKITSSLQEIDELLLDAGPHAFKELFDHANDAILATYGDDIVHCYANRRACDITGYNVKELMSLGIRDLVHPDERVKIENRFKKPPENIPSPCCYKTRIIAKNGAVTPVEVTVSRSEDAGKGWSFFILKDISKRMRFEQEMNKSLDGLKTKLKRREKELKIVSDKLHYQKKNLVKTKSDLEHLNRELVQTNQAMSVLAKNIDSKKNELEEKVHIIITTKIMPTIKDLQTDERIKRFWPEISSMAEYLNSIATKDNLYHKTISVLTETEMKVAAMVKNGMTSKKIADLMCISSETVKSHRKKIRRKLKIHNTKWKLSSYLVSVLGE